MDKLISNKPLFRVEIERIGENGQDVRITERDNSSGMINRSETISADAAVLIFNWSVQFLDFVREQ
jgi:hypothetical protein